MVIMSIQNNKLPDNICKIVASSIEDIIRCSLNDKFRSESFELLTVTNSKQLGEKVYKELKRSISCEQTLSDNESRNCETEQEEGLESIVPLLDKNVVQNENQPSLLEDKEITDILQICSLPQEVFQKDWLGMSSLKSNENSTLLNRPSPFLKRRLLNNSQFKSSTTFEGDINIKTLTI